MSISHIEDDPLDQHPDTVEFADPVHDLTVDQGGGIDTDESLYFPGSVPPRHIDPLGTALMRLGVGRSRELDRHPGFESLLRAPGDRPATQDPDAPFRARDLTSGTEGRPDRWIHDQALQVRQLAPTSFNGGQIVLPLASAGIPVQLAWAKQERLAVVLVNVGAATVYIGRTAGASISGFPLPAGGSITTRTLSDIWGCMAAATTSIIGYFDEYRTDVQVD